MRTGYNPADINRFRNLTGKKTLVLLIRSERVFFSTKDTILQCTQKYTYEVLWIIIVCILLFKCLDSPV